MQTNTSFELPTNPKLVFEDDGNGWVSCYLSDGDYRRKLGAESSSYLLTRISDRFNNPLTGEVCRQPLLPELYWVCSLAEEHHSFYINSNKTLLFIEDSEGNIVEELTLDDACITAWNEQVNI